MRSIVLGHIEIVFGARACVSVRACVCVCVDMVAVSTMQNETEMLILVGHCFFMLVYAVANTLQTSGLTDVVTFFHGMGG